MKWRRKLPLGNLNHNLVSNDQFMLIITEVKLFTQNTESREGIELN